MINFCELTFPEKDKHLWFWIFFSWDIFLNGIKNSPHTCAIYHTYFLWLGTCYLTTFDATLDLKCLPEYKLLQFTQCLFFFLFTYIFRSLFFVYVCLRLHTWAFLHCTLSCYKMMINIHTSMHWNLKVTPKFSPRPRA